MGLRLFSSSEVKWDSNRKASIDPNPSRFVVDHWYHLGGCTVALITYHGCTNYGGQKLLFWDRIVHPNNATKIDPHFNEHDYWSPFARFEPTPKGFEAADALAEMFTSIRSRL